MTSKFYIHWESNHVIKKNKHQQITEYCSYNISDEEQVYVYHIPNGYISFVTSLLNNPVSKNNIFTSDLKLYYFDGNILQCGLNEIYTMQKVKEDIFFCDQLFLLVDESIIYLLEVTQMNQLLNEMFHYYPLTELIFIYAKNCTTLYKWKTLYDKVLSIQMNEKSNIMKIWMNADIKHNLILYPLNYM